MTSKSTAVSRIKVIAGIELVALLISLIMPITPSKTGRRFHWPATWSVYFDDVLLNFVMVNGLFVVIVAAAWIYWKWSGGRSSGS